MHFSHVKWPVITEEVLLQKSFPPSTGLFISSWPLLTWASDSSLIWWKLSTSKLTICILWGPCVWGFRTGSTEVVGVLYWSSSRFQLPIVLWDRVSGIPYWPWSYITQMTFFFCSTSSVPNMEMTSVHHLTLFYVVPRLGLMALGVLAITLSAELNLKLSIIFIG